MTNGDVALAGFVFCEQDWAALDATVQAELIAAAEPEAAANTPADVAFARGSGPAIALPVAVTNDNCPVDLADPAA